MSGCGSAPRQPEPRAETPPPVAKAPARAQTPAPAPRTSRGGGYYLDDGPGDSPPPDLDAVPEPVPQLEPLHRAAMRPYVVLGHSFGGAEAVTFASTYSTEVDGLMLVDASPPTWPEAVCSVPAYAAGCALMRNPTQDAEQLDVFPAFERAAS